jgi:hypothetical protein
MGSIFVLRWMLPHILTSLFGWVVSFPACLRLCGYCQHCTRGTQEQYILWCRQKVGMWWLRVVSKLSYCTRMSEVTTVSLMIQRRPNWIVVNWRAANSTWQAWRVGWFQDPQMKMTMFTNDKKLERTKKFHASDSRFSIKFKKIHKYIHYLIFSCVNTIPVKWEYHVYKFVIIPLKAWKGVSAPLKCPSCRKSLLTPELNNCLIS